MATGKPPWSQQYQEVAALFHIGTTKSHPPIPEHLSVEAKDFLLKCLQEEPEMRPPTNELLKVLQLKKLQTPLVEEFQNSSNAARSPNFIETMHDDSSPNYLKLPPKSRSPSHGPIGTPSPAIEAASSASPGSGSRHVLNVGSTSNHSLQDSPSQLVVDVQPEPSSPSVGFSERHRKWKEELDQELERKREMMRQAGVGGKTSSPKDRALN